MPSFLETFPYPWPDRRAQELHLALVDIYPNSGGAQHIAQKVGLNRGAIFWEQNANLIWKEVLEQAASALLTRDLVLAVRDANPRNARKSFFDALLAEQPTPFDAEPHGQDGEPRFVRSTDEITEPEALLYHDDLTLTIGRVPALIETLQMLLKRAPAVCRIQSTITAGTQFGTAFRIDKNRLLTNHHVVHDEQGRRATQVIAEFGFEEDAAGNGLPTRVIHCDVASIVADAKDDWAVLVTLDPLDDAWPIIPLSAAATPKTGEAAFIIQHPKGNRKRIGFVRNQITNVDDVVVHYLTDTEGGSSGSPVFDAKGQIVALHHAGGRPQEVAGKAPMRKNEGIRISRVVAGLVAAGINTTA